MENFEPERAIINVEKTYHAEIVKIWKKVEKEPTFKKIFDYGAFAQDTLNENGILFLGVGASFDEEKKKTCKIKGQVQYETEKGRVGKDDKKGYAYYQPMIYIAKETGFGGNWSNIDITLFRETSQKKLLPFFKKFPDIMKAQLDLAKRMIIDARPKIIIASNALVRDVLINNREKSKVESDFVFNFSDEYGTQIIKSPGELEGTPIFFTSMLSGAGALDNGSFDRLIWHIKYVKEKLGH